MPKVNNGDVSVIELPMSRELHLSPSPKDSVGLVNVRWRQYLTPYLTWGRMPPTDDTQRSGRQHAKPGS